MAEYIEKEAAIKEIIEKDWLEKYYHGQCTTREIIESIPAADVRPVVLCRDCKWTKTDEMEDPAIYCEKWDRWEMPPDAFCYLGKHREAPDA